MSRTDTGEAADQMWGVADDKIGLSNVEGESRTIDDHFGSPLSPYIGEGLCKYCIHTTPNDNTNTWQVS